MRQKSRCSSRVKIHLSFRFFEGSVDARLREAGPEGRGGFHLRGNNDMASRLEIDHASIIDNDIEHQVEFTAELDGSDYDFAVKYSVLKELSGDSPENDALEMFERFGDEILDVCAEAAAGHTGGGVVIVDETDLE